MRNLRITFGLLVCGIACAGQPSPEARTQASPQASPPASGQAADQPAGQTARPSKQRDVVTREEILSSPQRNLDLFQALRSLRPHFLAPPPGLQRASAEPATAVYVGRTRQNGLDALRTILASNVDEVRYLDPTAAQNQFGAAASAGAVIVKLHTGMDPN